MFTSQTIGGLLNATLGNAVELIVAILALVKCELQVVQSSLIGSILSNLLLVCGMCFFAGEFFVGRGGVSESAMGERATKRERLCLLTALCVFLRLFHSFAVSPFARRLCHPIGRRIAPFLVRVYWQYPWMTTADDRRRRRFISRHILLWLDFRLSNGRTSSHLRPSRLPPIVVGPSFFPLDDSTACSCPVCTDVRNWNLALDSLQWRDYLVPRVLLLDDRY